MFDPVAIWSQLTVPALLGLALAALLALYLLRRFAHRLLLRAAILAARQLRLLARALERARLHLTQRNHEVMTALQEEWLQRQIERETVRIGHALDRDAGAFRHLEREINQQITTIAEDYEGSAQVPPPAPEWTRAVDAIARLEKEDSSSVMQRILGDIHETVQQHQREAMREYRWTVGARHKLLAGLRPFWRRLSAQVGRLSGRVDQLLLRVDRLDALVERYEQLRAGSSNLKLSSVLGRFGAAAIFLVLATGAAALGYELMAAPLQSLLEGRRVLATPLGDVLAVLHIAVVLALGVVLMEVMRLTRMFPLLGAIAGRARNVLVWGSAALLLLLAAGQSGLTGWQASGEPVGSPWPALLLRTLGFALPLIIVAAVVPLEQLLATLRSTLSAIAQALLFVGALALRLASRLVKDFGRLAIAVYDLVIFIPLLIEGAWHRHRERMQESTEDAPESASEPSESPAPLNITRLDFDNRGGS